MVLISFKYFVKFDVKVERLCQEFYGKRPYGRPSIAPGVYFRALLIGFFEGLARRTLPGSAPAASRTSG